MLNAIYEMVGMLSSGSTLQGLGAPKCVLTGMSNSLVMLLLDNLSVSITLLLLRKAIAPAR